jgi:hypothetical protein
VRYCVGSPDVVDIVSLVDFVTYLQELHSLRPANTDPTTLLLTLSRSSSTSPILAPSSRQNRIKNRHIQTGAGNVSQTSCCLIWALSGAGYFEYVGTLKCERDLRMQIERCDGFVGLSVEAGFRNAASFCLSRLWT